MMIRVAIIAVLAIINGVFYRMGGSGNYPRFMRPLGIGILTALSLFILLGFHFDWKFLVGVLASAGASAGLSTTYIKKKNMDAKWYNWLFVGIALSLALLPIAYADHLWLGFILRTVCLSPAIMLWSQTIGDAVLEENGRGFLHIMTLPLLLV